MRRAPSRARPRACTSTKAATDTGGYGYGFEIFGTDDQQVSFGHWGGSEEFLGFVNISARLRYTIVALCDRACDSMGPAILEFHDAIGMSL